MTIAIHPERVKAHALGDLAERMVYVAWQMGRLVRDEDRDSIGEFLDTLTGEEQRALLVVQAAMIPVDTATPESLLDWVRWDEFGYPLPGSPSPVPPPSPPRDARVYEDCGTLAAFHRHKKAGHRRELLEECGCGQVGRDYFNARYAARRDGKVARRARKSQTDGKVEDYAERRSRGDSIAEAGGRAGVSLRTAERYEARLLAEGRATWREADGAAA
jgi:hypothetical protein